MNRYVEDRWETYRAVNKSPIATAYRLQVLTHVDSHGCCCTCRNKLRRGKTSGAIATPPL